MKILISNFITTSSYMEESTSTNLKQENFLQKINWVWMAK